MSQLLTLALSAARSTKASSVIVERSVLLLLEAGRLLIPNALQTENPANRLVRSIVEFWENMPASTSHDRLILKSVLAS